MNRIKILVTSVKEAFGMRLEELKHKLDHLDDARLQRVAALVTLLELEEKTAVVASVPLWQRVSLADMARRLRERAVSYQGAKRAGLPDAAFDRAEIYD
ncbi:MAG: hypothetical protein ACFB12_24605 [Leptolyngbyaceae cyanobacterium]